MQSQQRKPDQPATPFQWQRYTAPHAAKALGALRAGQRAVAAGRKGLTAAERAARVLAQRWGNPYCKPGPV